VLHDLDTWAEIRRRVASGELRLRQAWRSYHLNFRTARTIVHQHDPPSYQATKPRAKPVLGPFLPLVHQILEEDRHAPPTQRHTARRLYGRLYEDHHYRGCPSIVRAAVAAWKQEQAEAFVPLVHPPGEAQCDCGRARVEVAGVRHQAARFVRTLPHSNVRFACLFPRECGETLQEGHVRAFAFLGGVPRRVRYDNSRLAVVQCEGRHRRRTSDEFARLQGPFHSQSQFRGVRQAQEKGHVENGVGYVRRNHLVPVPRASTWEEVNSQLTAACQRELGKPPPRGGRGRTELLVEGRRAFPALPGEPFLARRREVVTINTLALGRSDTDDYSVPTRHVRQTLSVTGTIDRVQFHHRGSVVAEHPRCWGRKQVACEPWHYLALLGGKPFAFGSAKPLQGWQLPDCFATLRRRLEEVDPEGGTRKYVQVLRLLEQQPVAVLQAAVERALRRGLVDANAIRLLVAKARAQPRQKDFDLSDRPRLSAVQVPESDLTGYAQLASVQGRAQRPRSARR
jgi:transposase